MSRLLRRGTEQPPPSLLLLCRPRSSSFFPPPLPSKALREHKQMKMAPPPPSAVMREGFGSLGERRDDGQRPASRERPPPLSRRGRARRPSGLDGACRDKGRVIMMAAARAGWRASAIEGR